MPSKVSNPPAGFDDLTVDEKLAYVESLWDRIAAQPESVPVPDWHLEVLGLRMREAGSSSPQGRSWDDFRQELRAKLRERRTAL